MTTTTRLVIPGAGTLEFTRDRATGALQGIDGGGRNYLRVERGVWHWADLCTTSENRDEERLVRQVETPHERWHEHYRWHGGTLTEVDGVVIRRDGQDRIVACLPTTVGVGEPAPADHRWLYSYGGPGPAHIAGPFGGRSVATTADGVVRSSTQDGILQRYRYDGHGHRVAPHRPSGDHVDDAGRCWASLDETRAIRHVYLWDGNRCLARIDGPVGAPLAAVFSLDPSATPVRIITPGGSVRIPRDAFGEGLLAHRGVPGLFGGQIHSGLVHLPLRRLDPRTGSYCEPDPCDGSASDPRRLGAYEGPLPAEPAPRSPYEVCRGDPVGRADPSGGVSAGLIVSTLTWSFQNNILTFFGLDWWFNLFASLIMAPFSSVENDFFSTTGLKASDRLGGFGLRRGGVINAITGGRAFTTQHIVWSPDSEFAELERGEVIDPGGELVFTHYGSILAITPAGRPRLLMQSMNLAGRDWVDGVAPGSWTRHGGRGVAVAPGTLTPWFPSGGLHLDTTLDTRHDTACDVAELVPAAVGLGDLQERSFLTVPSGSGLAAEDLVVVSDGTNLEIASVVTVAATGTEERVELDEDLDALADTGLDIVQIAAVPASTESRGAGSGADSIDVHGTAATYAANDLIRLTASGDEVTVARVERLEAQLPLDRRLPAGFGGPIAVASGVVAPGGTTVTMAGANLDFGAAPRPSVGATGLVSGIGTDVAVRIESHAGTSEVVIDVAPLPPAITGAATITFRPIAVGTVLGTRAGSAEAAARLTYTPVAAGTAPDGSGGTFVVQCSSGGIDHARILTGAPNHDVAVLDRAIAGAAPFDTERFPAVAGGIPVTGVTRADVVGLVVPDLQRFESAPAVFLTWVAGDPPTRAAPLVLSAVDVAAGVIVTTQPAATPVTRLEPGRPVLVGDRVAAISGVRVTATLDRPYDLAPDGLRAVELQPTGDAYLAEATGPDEVVVQALVDVAGTTVEIPFPRFIESDLVRITDRAGADETWHRIISAEGGVLHLTDGPALTAGDDLLVRHVATINPGNGGPFLAIDGTRTGTGPIGTATFSVWSADALEEGTVIGVIDGAVTHPTTVVGGATGTQDLEVRFSEEFDAAAVDVAALNHVANGAAFVTTVARDGDVLLVDGPAGTPALPTDQSLVVVAYTGNGATGSGTLGPGTLLVPEAEDTEVDRSQSLVDHELTHTLQYAKWGPLWFNAFPMLAMELPGILATDTELPEYSRFLDGAIEPGTGSRWNLTITDTGGVSIGDGDELQVIQGARRAKVEVAAVDGSVFAVRARGTSPPTGDVSVRKKQSASVFDGFFAFFDLLTHGGLVNALAGTTWGGIFWSLGKLFYGLGRAIAGTGDLYPATVQDGGAVLTLSDDAGKDNIRAEGRIVVRHGDDTVVRSMTKSGAVVTMAQEVPFSGDVQVAMYDTHDPGNAFDWYDYHPATVVDAANPAVIELAAANGDTLSLSPEDRVQIKYRGEKEFKTDVIAASGSTVELLDPITIIDGELTLRIARVGASDPLGNADTALMVDMGMGWMKWLFDPYGQIEFAAAPEQEWARWLLRVMRWVLGTQNFSLLPFGYVWWGRLFPIEPEHLAPIEQEASEESGDLYSPLGRLLGERRDDGFARARMVVGDVARYRFWPNGRDATFVNRGQLDAPGVNYRTELRTMPNRVATGGGGDPPNVDVVVDAAVADPGRFVAAPFTVRDVDPRAIPGGDALGFSTGDLGQVPVSARTQRMQSTYVAFTRPGDHRVTTVNNIEGFDVDGVPIVQGALDAHNAERQTLFFDVTAEDVTITVAGQAVAQGGTVTMVPFQRIAVTVTPNTSRTYRTSVGQPQGPVLRVDGDGRLAAVGVGAGEAVEISRFYEPDGSGDYGPGGLAFAGMHLSRPRHFPVRRFAVDVVDTLPLRDAADPAAAEVASLAIGADGFILVPAPITVPPHVTSIAGNPPAAGDPNPVEQVDAPDAAAFLGTAGAAFRVRFPDGATTGDVVITTTVGDGATSADLATTFPLIG